jgi:hypothetical protein
MRPSVAPTIGTRAAAQRAEAATLSYPTSDDERHHNGARAGMCRPYDAYHVLAGRVARGGELQIEQR